MYLIFLESKNDPKNSLESKSELEENTLEAFVNKKTEKVFPDDYNLKNEENK